MKQYQAIVFDFDMTLADSSHVIVDLLNDCAAHFGYARKSYEETLPVVGNTHEIMLSYVTGEKNAEKLYEMREHYRRLCREEMAARTTFFPGVPECLEAIRAKGMRIGLLSLKLRDVLMQSLVKYHLDGFFSTVVGCEEVPRPKPDPSGLFQCMKHLNVPADGLLYIGDSLVDEGAARGAGVDFRAMLLGGTAKEQFDPKVTKGFYTSLNALREDVNRLEEVKLSRKEAPM